MCLLNEFISVFALNTPLKVTTEYDDKVIYGQCYKGAYRDTTFEVFSIEELIEKFGNYAVIFSCIRNNILDISIDKRS